MTSLSNFNLINGSVFRVGKPAPSSPNQESGFKNASQNSNIKYKSYDGWELKNGDTVFQIEISPSFDVVKLKSFQIVELSHDGRVRVQEINANQSSLIQPNQLYYSSQSLLRDWVAQLKLQISVELPKLLKNLENIAKENKIEINQDIIEVGTGLTEEEI